MQKLTTYLPSLLELVQIVSKEILSVYHQASPYSIEIKTDHSPLTQADTISNQLLVTALKKITPDIPVISEESPAIPFAQRKSWKKFWLVDPLDGTREFIAKTDEFSINIALIENHQPVLGVIHAPVTGVTYYAVKNISAHKRLPDGAVSTLSVKKLNRKKPLIIASRRHANNIELQRFFAYVENYERLSQGSALKFGLIAEGCADIYPRFGDTSEWDTAAGQCIVEAAGGHVVDIHLQPLRYNTRPTFLNPHFFAIGDGLDFLTKWSEHYAK